MNIEIYTEYTPNPDSLKFVANKVIAPNRSLDFKEVSDAEEAPLAKALFDYPYVNGVFIANNFVTIKKVEGPEWIEIIPEIKAFLKDYITQEKAVLSPDFDKKQSEKRAAELGGESSELDIKISELLDTYVKPAIEMDGGNIVFKSFDSGVVTVMLQGACSGCPSSTATLKQGIEGLLKRMVPEVESVVAEQE